MYSDCSIIIPAFNASSTIGKILECLNGNSRFNCEIIIVDDGSTDNTRNIVKHFKNINPRIKLITKQNGGVSSARNKGLEEATGKWIYFADADDELSLNELDKMIAAGNSYGVDMVVSDYMEKNMVSGDNKKIACLLPYDAILKREYIERQILRRYFTGDNVGLATLWNKIYRKNVIDSHSLRFDENRTHGEDWKFNINYFEVANLAIALNTTVYTYILDGSQSYTKYGKKMGDCLIEGHAIAKRLNELYAFVDESSEEYRKFMNRFLNQSLNYVKKAQFSDKDKRAFLYSPEEQELYRYLLRMKPSDLEKIGHSRKSLVAFLMLKLGFFRLGLRILEVD